MSDNIKVVVKVRPLISREIQEKLSYQWRVKNNTLYQIDQNEKGVGQYFTFDKVYDEDTKTSDVYDDIAKPIVQAATAGFNGTIFAYGQTSSGKTYTMTGTDSSPGIIPLAVLNLFEIIKNNPNRDFLVRVSFIEIYNERVKDLLNVEKDNIKVNETHEGIKVDATERVTSSPEEVLEAMKEGEANRQTGATNMNEQSSRSHSIFQITIESREHLEGDEQAGCVNVSTLNLVDLAGSERAGQTGATGIRFKEGTHINKSLSSLALVIKQLSEGPNKYANYRDSKLTRILQNSLGGNAKTGIICAVTPAAMEETVSTLQFANRAKAIKNKPEVNAVVTVDETMLHKLTKKMTLLQTQLETKKHIEEDNLKLQKEIAGLRKFILNGLSKPTAAVSAARRKLPAPRRVTISTLHAEHEPVAPPRFCTPALKYNPLLLAPLPRPPAGAPLSSVPEERSVTPPRTQRFSDVIELVDSDDDSVNGDGKTCSPVHQCFGVTKTPPCVLRRNAKLAEKNLQDIVELTEREKIYTPSVVEYIEKLEENATVIAKLKDEIDSLNKENNEKNSEVDQLKEQIKKTEDDMKAIISDKAELTSKCDRYSTQITDWEFSYETLLKKAKLREDELLSLLEDQKSKKPEDIGKLLSRTFENFMDMSKDISLINSDNDNSIVHTNDEPERNINNIISNTQEQLTVKNKNIIELETDIFNHKQTIAALESRLKELEQTVCSFKELLSDSETENSLLKSTIDTLNTTIANQKTHLKTANSDIESYNSVIQELQIKITQKENIPKININDSVLENLIATEEKFIASNDNMKNIIQCLKRALEIRNKEIDDLKIKLKTNNDVILENKSLADQITVKTEQIEQLHSEVEAFSKTVNENIAAINKLIHENKDLKHAEQVLCEKLSKSESTNMELKKFNQENEISLKTIKEECDNFALLVTEKDLKEKEIAAMNDDLLRQVDMMTNQINGLEKEINDTRNLISSLKENEKQSEEGLIKAKAAVVKLQAILESLSGDIEEVPEIIDNFTSIFSTLSVSLNTLENVTNNIVRQKEELKTQLEEQINKRDTEITNLRDQINNKNNYSDENGLLNVKVNKLNDDLLQIRIQLNNVTQEKEKIEANVSELSTMIDCKDEEMAALVVKHELCAQMLVVKDNVIADLTTQIETLQKNKENMQQLCDEMVCEKEKLISELTEKSKENLAVIESANNHEDCDKILQIKEQLLTGLTTKIDQLENTLKDKQSKINNLISQQKNADKEKCLIRNISKKMLDLSNSVGIQHELSENFDNNEEITHVLDKIAHHITFLNSKNDDCVDSDLNKQMCDLTQSNVALAAKLSDIELKNRQLLIDLDQIQEEKTNLTEDCVRSEEILKQLHAELKTKANELSNMEEKVRKWKEQFTDLDLSMKQQFNELHSENEYLKKQLTSSLTSPETSSEETIEASVHDRIADTSLNSNSVSPPSLLTICCNKIVDSIHPKEIASNTSSVASDVETPNDDTRESQCTCGQLTRELEIARYENVRLTDLLERVELVNRELLREQEAVREELELLAVPARELQKKIVNHKTNLSILTATTFAENWSLKSQVKALQHHHRRFHNVCQRDIPDFKNQLRELLALLRGDPALADPPAGPQCRSLPDVLDGSGTPFRNESTLDGDLLMLDTTLAPLDLDLDEPHSDASAPDDRPPADPLGQLPGEDTKMQKSMQKCSDTIQYFEHAQSGQFEDLNGSSRDSGCRECERAAERMARAQDEKADVERKYRDLLLELPASEGLRRKLSALEKEYDRELRQISKLNAVIAGQNDRLKSLQEENDSLSTQVMENVTEVDDLNKLLDGLKARNAELADRCARLERSLGDFDDKNMETNGGCAQCAIKDELLRKLDAAKSHGELNRSLSDSDTSSRRNKICTLRSELHAGREDCAELTENVVTIKKHLERGDLAMDLDDGDAFEAGSVQSALCGMPDIPEERSNDAYGADKLDCLNYYVEKIGFDKDKMNGNFKMIEIMKMFYENLISRHGNEVQNLTNKLKDYDESKSEMELQLIYLNTKCTNITKTCEENHKRYDSVADVLHRVGDDMSHLKLMIESASEGRHLELLHLFKEKFFNIIDTELNLGSGPTFEILMNKILNTHQVQLNEIVEKYSRLQQHTEGLTNKLNSLNVNLETAKSQLSAAETELNLVKAQKARIYEISNAVTLDIVKKEVELNKALSDGYRKLGELNIVNLATVDLTSPSHDNIIALFNYLIDMNRHYCVEKERLAQEIGALQRNEEDKIKELNTIKLNNEALQAAVHLKDKKLETIEAMHTDLTKLYESKLEESKTNVDLIEKLSQEVGVLQSNIADKQRAIAKLESEIQAKHYQEQSDKLAELIQNIKDLHNENANLKLFNEMITKERDAYAAELNTCGETFKQNNIEMDKMTSDILVLREAVKENSLVIEKLNMEAKSLLQRNQELQEQVESRTKECSTLATNIKIHENTAQVQSRMIIRLQNQKAEDDKTISEKQKQITELSDQCSTLQAKWQDCCWEKERVSAENEALQTQVSQMKDTRRRSLSIAEPTRDHVEHSLLEAVFESRSRPDDLFAEARDHSSNRSTPTRHSRGRDSLSSSRMDQELEPGAAARRRRQTAHDTRRSVPAECSKKAAEEPRHMNSSGSDSSACELKKQLATCQQELEELRERYRELDDECETCAAYLRDRDELCARLKRERVALQTTVAELREQLARPPAPCAPRPPARAHAAVNTDEDWTNLHSVVVDRMSYDAEVEKNKRLARTIEELRHNKQDLKNTLAKMQKALDRHAGNRELEIATAELAQCREELEQLRRKYRELDEECDTCAQYLRERDDTCRRLRAERAALEAKLQELRASPARARRLAHYDRRRHAETELSQAECKGSTLASEDTDTKDVKQLQSLVTSLRAALASAQRTPLAAAGSAIVQNQQLSDVMKENQKLKITNAKLVSLCMKRGKDSDRENRDPAEPR